MKDKGEKKGISQKDLLILEKNLIKNMHIAYHEHKCYIVLNLKMFEIIRN